MLCVRDLFLRYLFRPPYQTRTSPGPIYLYYVIKMQNFSIHELFLRVPRNFLHDPQSFFHVCITVHHFLGICFACPRMLLFLPRTSKSLSCSYTFLDVPTIIVYVLWTICIVMMMIAIMISLSIYIYRERCDIHICDMYGFMGKPNKHTRKHMFLKFAYTRTQGPS